MAQENLIDFDLIEGHKENIQALPSGRSAKALASIFSSGPGRPLGSVPTHDLNDPIRQEYEKELANIDESDDPLDIYDRYVKWTLDAYPSAQATPQSQLLPLLERATKTFLTSPQYKNDARYLKIWLHYVRLFSDAPRETFAYLNRHGIGDGLALFYEEFAAWLENAERWSQAEEVYQLGIDRQARPQERLIRKYAEFQHRAESRPQDAQGPSSPALPTVRPALAAKVDPFSLASPVASNPQASAQQAGSTTSKPARQKLAIFSDADAPAKVSLSGSSTGWDNIESIRDRKKENTVEAKPWAGETLKGTVKKNNAGPKMMIFKDQTLANKSFNSNPLRYEKEVLNERTNRMERVFVDIENLYCESGEEFCFEELIARHRGWLQRDWASLRSSEQEWSNKAHHDEKLVEEKPLIMKKIPIHIDELPPPSENLASVQEHPVKKITVHLDGPCSDSENRPPGQHEIAQKQADRARRARKEEKANRTRKIKVLEVRQEPQTVALNLDSPTGKKVKRKKQTEATVTIHTREAMDEIYGIFNQPLQTTKDVVSESESSEESESDEDDDDDEYTSAGESTGKLSTTTSEFGDMTAGDFTIRSSVDTEDRDHKTDDDDDDSQSVNSEWSEFTASKHVPRDSLEEDGSTEDISNSVAVMDDEIDETEEDENDGLITPTSPVSDLSSSAAGFLQAAPDACSIPKNPYRDPHYVAQSRLPFMTPIVEKTETSLGAATALANKDYFDSKTPCRAKGMGTPTKPSSPGNELWSSPFGTDPEDEAPLAKVPQPVLQKKIVILGERQAEEPVKLQPQAKQSAAPKGPIIDDAQCNPVDELIRNNILSQIQPPLSSYEGFCDCSNQVSGRGAEIRKFIKALQKVRGGSDKTTGSVSMPPVLRFDGSHRKYTLKRELGKGAFAPVYLVESEMGGEDVNDENAPAAMGKGAFSVARGHLEAVKMEDPPSVWEFYILQQAKRRLGVSRATESLVRSYEMHLFKDECFLIEQYSDQGTLLDLINIARGDKTTGGVMDEQVAMFFTIELLRTVEALHGKGLLHGDIKADNVLVRLNETSSEDSWSTLYCRDGTHGWSEKGVTLIDFGRGIDMRVFKPEVQFIADWKTTEADCAEMREMRPWTYQIDYHGIAGVVHTLLFGKYIETVAERGSTLGAGQTKTYKVRESLKRYWQTELWSEVFDLMLNPLLHLDGEEGRKLPVLKGMRSCRERMETWLETNSEKGVGLKAQLRRLEVAIKERKR